MRISIMAYFYISLCVFVLFAYNIIAFVLNSPEAITLGKMEEI